MRSARRRAGGRRARAPGQPVVSAESIWPWRPWMSPQLDRVHGVATCHVRSKNAAELWWCASASDVAALPLSSPRFLPQMAAPNCRARWGRRAGEVRAGALGDPRLVVRRVEKWRGVRSPRPGAKAGLPPQRSGARRKARTACWAAQASALRRIAPRASEQSLARPTPQKQATGSCGAALTSNTPATMRIAKHSIWWPIVVCVCVCMSGKAVCRIRGPRCARLPHVPPSAPTAARAPPLCATPPARRQRRALARAGRGEPPPDGSRTLTNDRAQRRQGPTRCSATTRYGRIRVSVASASPRPQSCIPSDRTHRLGLAAAQRPRQAYGHLERPPRIRAASSQDATFGPMPQQPAHLAQGHPAIPAPYPGPTHKVKAATRSTPPGRYSGATTTCGNAGDTHPAATPRSPTPHHKWSWPPTPQPPRPYLWQLLVGTAQPMRIHRTRLHLSPLKLSNGPTTAEPPQTTAAPEASSACLPAAAKGHPARAGGGTLPPAHTGPDLTPQQPPTPSELRQVRRPRHATKHPLLPPSQAHANR